MCASVCVILISFCGVVLAALYSIAGRERETVALH